MTDESTGGPTPPPNATTFEVGVRRVAELDLAAPLPPSDERLVAQIAAEIRERGPMTFARFMAIALYDPMAGYYTAGVASSGESDAGGVTGPGRAADFLTAPEGHPIFGWALARHLESVWDALDRPSRFVIREHGAGSGALAAGILEGLRRSNSELLSVVRYQAIDVAPERLAALATRLAALGGLDRHLLPATDTTPAPGAILANELLDALPVHRIEGGPDGSLLERYVAIEADAERAGDPPAAAHVPRSDNAPGGVPSQRAAAPPSAPASAAGTTPAFTQPPRFTTVLAPPSTPALAARLASEDITLLPGQPAEICLALDAWVAEASAPLERGELLLIDYGYPAEQLYRPDRGSTLRAYHRHRVHADPLVAIGRQDLTAHVDLTAVERAAMAAGLAPIGRTTQAQFLAELGAGELLVALQSESGATLESYLEARSALVRMLDPRATGAFAVVRYARGMPERAAPG